MILLINKQDLPSRKEQAVTPTTNRRQLRLTINAVLEKYKIDNLALEGVLTDAITKFVDDTKAGKDPVKVRLSILDGILHFSGKYHDYELMTERVEVALRLHPDGGDAWNAVVDHCNKKLELSQTIEQYAEWLAADKFNSPKAHQIAQNPKIIITTWPQAFVATTPTQDALPVTYDNHNFPVTY